MSENPAAIDGLGGSPYESRLWPTVPEECSPAVGKACAEFLCFLRVADALIRISRVIGDRRRRAEASGSSERWWPNLNRRLIKEVLIPLIDDLDELENSCRLLNGAALDVLRETLEFLAQPQPQQKLPKYKTVKGLVDQYLSPLLASLIETANAEDDLLPREHPCQGVELINQLRERSLRGWLEHDGGVELEQLLQWLMLGEYYTSDYVDDLKPNIFDRAKTRSSLQATQPEALWDEATLDALLGSIGSARNHFGKKLALQVDRESRATVVFCELCDEPTQRMAHGHDPAASGSGSARFCARHASAERGLYQRDMLNGQRFEHLRSLVLAHARHDSDYRLRLLEADAESRRKLASHIADCAYCGGHPLAQSCFDPSYSFFASLVAYHANARKVAYRLAGSHHSDGRSSLLLEAVQQGRNAKEAAAAWGLRSDKAIGQHSGLALAWLIQQRASGAEIAERLGISQSAVSQRRQSLAGSFDFAADRWDELVWWPYDDIFGSEVARFPSTSLGAGWRHTSAEYGQLLKLMSVGRRSMSARIAPSTAEA